MSYHERGKNNPVDACMAGICVWVTPRQIIILDKAFKFLQNYKEQIFSEGTVEEEAFLDFKDQIGYEAEIKKKKYFGGDDEESYSFSDPA